MSEEKPTVNTGESNQRKERVLHTRIPESLDEAIRQKAQDLGVSVSNLVRNVLANSVGVVEGLMGDGQTLVRRARQRAQGQGPGTPTASGVQVGFVSPVVDVEPVVLGWQEATLNVNAVCDQCNAILPRGTRAAIAITEPSHTPRAIRCLRCLQELEHEQAPE